MISSLKKNIPFFVSIFLAITTTLFFTRVWEWFSLNNRFSLSPDESHFILYGFSHDLLLFASIGGGLFITYLLIETFNHTLAKGFLTFSFLMALLLHLSLSRYFLEGLIPLDSVVFSYSPSELFDITTKFGTLSWMDGLLFFTTIALFFLLQKIFAKRSQEKLSLGITVTCLFLLLASPFYSIPSSEFDSEREYQLYTNKLSYFTASVGNSLFEEDVINKEDSKAYPFLKRGAPKNVLGPYFQLDEKTPPNLVFVIVESLSRTFSGPNAKIGSFTPFLDSLADHSLYWENFLSNAERTFGVLPNSFASLPDGGSQGFMAMGENMPKHHSLFTLAQKNLGYHTAFYYGSWKTFDDMHLFLERQEMDLIMDWNYFGNRYQKTPGDQESGFTWGFPDKALFGMSFIMKDSLQPKTPYLDVYLTLSMHGPFMIPEEKYHHAFDVHLSKLAKGSNEEVYDKNRKPLTCVLYTDDALRSYFKEFQQREEYKNTIFVIMGDHNMGNDMVKSPIDRYHVPFLIYSPMLKKAKRFPNVSCHRDITPTFTALLEPFGIKSPKKVSWVGQELDTSSTFSLTREMAFTRTNRSVTDYLKGEYFLFGERLYKVGNDLALEKSEVDSIKTSLNEALADYKMKNTSVSNSMSLFPD